MYKIMRGFGQDDFLPIEADEVEKAIYCHMTGKVGSFRSGSINGTHISAVMPDYHSAMGWNYSHKLDTYDWDDIRKKGVDRLLQKGMSEAKEKVQYLMQTKQEHLIGKGFEMPKLDKGYSDDIEGLAGKMKM